MHDELRSSGAYGGGDTVARGKEAQITSYDAAACWYGYKFVTSQGQGPDLALPGGFGAGLVAVLEEVPGFGGLAVLKGTATGLADLATRLADLATGVATFVQDFETRERVIWPSMARPQPEGVTGRRGEGDCAGPGTPPEAQPGDTQGPASRIGIVNQALRLAIRPRLTWPAERWHVRLPCEAVSPAGR